MSDDTITLALHGLQSDNEFVRADVFAKKLNAFIQGLIAADKAANGGKSLHTFVVEDLKKSSAIATIREKQRTRARPEASAVRAWERGARAIYNGDPSAKHFDKAFVNSMRKLGAGSAKVFDHAEVSVGDAPEPAKILRIDDYIQRQAEEVLRAVAADEGVVRTPVFKGVAVGSFDGMLQLIDSRGPGQVLKAKLVTTAGRVQIECVVPKQLTQRFADSFDQRVRVEGLAHYDGKKLLPARVDVRSITPVRANADLIRWRGAFSVSAEASGW